MFPEGIGLAELTFKINDFEGPLDLLLHLISKHKMQLFDIQIYQLIDQYLNYIGNIGPERIRRNGGETRIHEVSRASASF